MSATNDIDDLIHGGPGIAPRGGPSMKEIVINGAKFLVPADSADAILAANAAQDERFNSLSRQMAALRPASATPPPADDDIDTQLFANPTATLQKVGERIKNELRGEYTLAEEQRQWWNSFYGAHEHLKGSEVIVRAILEANMEELRSLPLDRQQPALAEKVEAQLARFIKSRPSASSGQNSRPVESGNPVGGTGPQDTPLRSDASSLPADRVVSISQRLRDQRKRRFDARFGTGAH